MADSKNDDLIPIPEPYSRRRLNALYREIPLPDTHSRMLRKYFNAMANLYGIIPLRKAFEIIQEQNRNRFTEEELLAFAEIARHEEEDYYILGLDELYTDGKPGDPLDREIIDVFLLDGDISAYHETLRSQRGKPYYIPPKKELLKYDDMLYCEPTPEYEAFVAALRSKTGNSDLNQAVLADFIMKMRIASTSLSGVMDEVNRLGVRFNDNADVNRFLSVYNDFQNNCRMQCNRGHTPREIMEMVPPEERIPKSLSFGPNIRKALTDGTMDAEELKASWLWITSPARSCVLICSAKLRRSPAARRPNRRISRKSAAMIPAPAVAARNTRSAAGGNTKG
jgi:hypothetical protein